MRRPSGARIGGIYVSIFLLVFIDFNLGKRGANGFFNF